MDLFEAVAKRTCCRSEFNDVPISRDVLTKVLEAGIAAPSACNAQSPSFVAVDDPKILAQIAEILPIPTCQTAKAVIVCISDARPVFGDISFFKEDCAAAVENMLLALTAFGYSSVWLDGVLRREQKAEKIAELLQIPEEKRVQILLPIGVPAGAVPKAPRFPFERRASFNVWENQK